MAASHQETRVPGVLAALVLFALETLSDEAACAATEVVSRSLGSGKAKALRRAAMTWSAVRRLFSYLLIHESIKANERWNAENNAKAKDQLRGYQRTTAALLMLSCKSRCRQRRDAQIHNPKRFREYG